MIKTEYDVWQVIHLPWKVAKIIVTENATMYRLECDVGGSDLILNEENIQNAECISMDAYEAEINAMKDEITRLREMYQLEHMKVLKLKYDAVQGDSHHPHSNTYSDDWRRP